MDVIFDGNVEKLEEKNYEVRIYRRYARVENRQLQRIMIEGEFRKEKDKLFRYAHAASLGLASPETIASVYQNQGVSSYKVRRRMRAMVEGEGEIKKGRPSCISLEAEGILSDWVRDNQIPCWMKTKGEILT